MITKCRTCETRCPRDIKGISTQETTHLTFPFSKSEEQPMSQLHINKESRSPLQFELETSRKDIYQNVFALREKAEKLFSNTSKVFRLFDDNCLPEGSEDMLLEPKLMSQCLSICGKKIVTTWPASIVGFAFLLPTNRVGYIGFSTYKNEEQGVWFGLVETFGDNESFDDCVESHRLCCELLSKAKELGILKEVNDPTNYWDTKDPDSFAVLNKESELESE